MKQISLICLCSIILLQSFSKLFIIADYEVNKEYISQVLCENRSKPQMHCNGKCQLKKQLAEDEKRQDSPVNPLKEKNEVQIFSSFDRILTPSLSSLRVQQSSVYLIPASGSHLSAVFHPPAV